MSHNSRFISHFAPPKGCSPIYLLLPVRINIIRFIRYAIHSGRKQRVGIVMSGIIEANKRMLLPILLFLGGPAGEAAEIGGFYNSYGVVGDLALV